VIACALGMATKQVMVGAPLLVLLWDWTFGQRLRWKLYIALASTWLLLGYLVASAPRPHSVGSFEGWTPLVYLTTQAGVILHYLRLVVTPFPLVFDYDWPPARGMVQIGVPGIIVGALVALTLAGVFRRRPWAFAGAWFFVILAPSSSVLPIVTEVAAEHRMYLPLAAVLSLIVLSAYRWSARTRRRWLVPAVCLLLAVVLGAQTIARNRDYESDERIWADTVEKRPTNPRARNNYAIDLLKAGRLGDAEAHVRAALDSTPAGQEGPRMAEVHQTLGVVLLSTGRADEGITELRRALDLDPTYGKAYQNLGEAYGAKGDLASAARAFLEAARYLPDDAFVLNRAGWLLATAPDDRIRDGARALTLARHAVEVTRRRDVNSLDTLAAAHAERGEFDAAVTAEQEALDLARANGDAAMVPELQERLSIYQARRPFRTR
jgi:tetratricopeptide (TPR) repeat protein